MTTAELVRFGLFLSAVVTVFFLAAGIVVRLVLQRYGIIRLPSSSGAIWLRRCILGAAVLGAICIAHGFLIEPYWPQVTHVQIRSPKLPAGSRPIRIIQISDIHSDRVPRLEERLPGIISAQRPDLIVFTGDAINSPEGLPHFRRCITDVAAIAPTFAVRGNWDVWFFRDLDRFGGTGVEVLDGRTIVTDVRGTPVWVAGVPYDSEGKIAGVLATIPANAFSIFLYHTPDEIYEVAKQSVDLSCAGHIHGGQIALPFYGALITLSRFGKRFEAGLYRVGGTWLYVNRGIGMEGGAMPRVRFWSRPEVTVIDVHPDGN